MRVNFGGGKANIYKKDTMQTLRVSISRKTCDMSDCFFEHTAVCPGVAVAKTESWAKKTICGWALVYSYLRFSNSVFPVTLRLLSSMADTATRGVNNPLMARGMLTVL